MKEQSQDNHSVEVFKSRNTTQLNLQAFHADNPKEKSYSTFKVNGLIFSNHKLNNLVLSVLHGEYTIDAGAIGKERLEARKIKVNKGDSVVIKFYLRDDTNNLLTPEYEPEKD